MTDVYHIKAEVAMQYEHGWTVSQENFNRYLNEQTRHGNPGKRVRRRFSSAAMSK